LAIECHAYDVQFDRLFNQTTIFGVSSSVYPTYNRLLSSALLNLAIAIRVALSSELEYRDKSYVTPAALFLEGGPHADGTFSIKDLCDKLIHADKVWKPIEPGVQNAGCELVGYHGKKKWVVGLGVQIFCECVLKWLDEIENRRSVVRAANE
jgi:hypothetical protein